MYLKSVSLLRPVQETWQCGSSLPKVSELKKKSLHFPPRETIKHFCTPTNLKDYQNWHFPHNLAAQKSSIEPNNHGSAKVLPSNKYLERPTRLFVSSRKVTFLLQTL